MLHRTQGFLFVELAEMCSDQSFTGLTVSSLSNVKIVKHNTGTPVFVRRTEVSPESIMIHYHSKLKHPDIHSANPIL